MSYVDAILPLDDQCIYIGEDVEEENYEYRDVVVLDVSPLMACMMDSLPYMTLLLPSLVCVIMFIIFLAIKVS